MKKTAIIFTLLASIFVYSQKTTNSQGSQKGIPPSPPFQEAEVKAENYVVIGEFWKLISPTLYKAVVNSNVTKGYFLSDKNQIGYLISYKKNTNTDNEEYEMLIQNKNGVQSIYFLKTDKMSHIDKNRLPYILIPGNKLEMKVKICENGGFTYIVNLKNLKREENKKEYLYGVPPSPPFREAEAIISDNLTKGCSLSYKIGYLISYSDYDVVIQDKNGVRRTYFIDTDIMSNTDKGRLPYILIPGNKLKIAVEFCKDTGEYNEIMNLKNLKRKESAKSYLYGIPPSPPFRKINVTACTNITDGCSLSDKKWIGYIISYRKNRYGSGYEIIIQDKNGARETHFLETDEMPNADKSKLPHVLIPGNKLEMKVQFCGSGGFIYIMSLKTIKREK